MLKANLNSYKSKDYSLLNLLPSPLALLDLVVTAGLRQGCYPLVRLPHSIGTGTAGPVQAQSSC